MGNTFSCSNGGRKKSKLDFQSREYYRMNTSEMSAKNSEKIDNSRQKESGGVDKKIGDKKASAIDDNFDGLKKVRKFSQHLGCN